MKVDVVWRRGVVLTACCLVLCLHRSAFGADPLGPSDRPEAYFNGSSYIHLTRPISLKQLVGLSFRTCVGGELFSQRFERYTLHVTALYERVAVSWALPTQDTRTEAFDKETLDNKWHWVALRYRPNPPALLLVVDKDSQVISNVTWNPELLSPGALEAGGAEVLVGNLFSGCIHEGPQLEFHAANSQFHNILFGNCPLSTDECKDGKDVLRIPPKDHCYNEPCMRHGTCISRHDRYECHCTARYTGNNCEVDAGDPCAAAPCAHGGRCELDARGDYACVCPPRYHGTHCELEVSLDPQCVAGPCRNNGSCSVPPGASSYVCDCPPGFAGRNCELDVDECAALEPGGGCLNGGRCQDAANNFTCDCTGTGYTGPRCETNVNECEEDWTICGHGVCYDTYGGFVCACQPGYTGERCHRMSACASGPCGAGGACVEESGGSGFRCVCARGWAPPLCNALLPAPPTAPPAPAAPPAAACAELQCPPRSHCAYSNAYPEVPSAVMGVAISKQAWCVCDAGYFGAPGPAPNCSLAGGACAAGVCLHGAACRQEPDAFSCACPPTYRGVYCEQPTGAGAGAGAGKALQDLKAAPVSCAAAPCLHARDCQDLAMGFRCECEPGWAGARCDTPLATAAAGGEACGCLNGGSCREAAGGGVACECRAGFSGAACEQPLDCRAASCPPRHECVEQGGLWRCAAPSAESACASSPCHNGTCLALDSGLFRCQCPPEYTGRLCEIDIDECTRTPKICNNGVCVNVPGSYQCYCRPGYTGDSCELDIDECLSSPCKHGGTCQNLENNYECECMDGFEGKDCSVNIDECESAPCAAGATCVDGVAGFSCACPAGLAGPTCATDIDDCESAPCQHGGRCVDELNGFRCECAGTGFSGAVCDVNIDECAPQPCRNGGVCVDDVNDYRCTCHAGYTGKNCETDIDECEGMPCQYGGVCLERSNASLYRPAESPPWPVGPQPQMVLPPSFYRPFSYENASGFECVCVAGTLGARCELNVDECASSPCGHGKCVDGVGSYRCECAAGFEGEHCDQDIDECLRLQPCVHGRCVDGRATYYCVCAQGWGGRNCSVLLTGCKGEPCGGRGACLPWLRHETDHRFNCTCAPGHFGTTCARVTTMSLGKGSYAEVNTSREEGYDLSFRFKTTLGNSLLAMGSGLTYFFLELSAGRLNLHSSLLNKWEGVFIGSNLNDSNWQKVFVTINSSHLVLAANEEQTIYPINQNEAFNASVTSFPSTRLGNAGSSYATLRHGPNFFVGCFQDVVVNGQWVLPEDSQPANGTAPPAEGDGEAEEVRAELRGVRAHCPRRPQCAPNPCRSGGACEDAWTSFVCTCPRPHLGDTCQYNYTAATFGHEGAPRASVAVRVAEGARRAVRAALDISMFIRTRKPHGQIFYLGSLPKASLTDETQVSAALWAGELLVQLRFNQTSENYTVGGTRLDNGYLHLIQVVRNSTLVQVKLNGTEYFRKSISAAKQLDAQVLYLGGPPPLAAAPPPGAPPSGAAPATAAPSDAEDAEYFKGVIQDVQVSNGVNATVVEFFPLAVPGLALPPPFGEVALDPLGVLRGVVSDDACASRPCLHNATCALTWNDYTCTCLRGYKGKQCAEVEFCQLQGCPFNSHCRNLDAGYECVSEATFDGANTTLSYRLRVPPGALQAPAPPTDLTIAYRSKTGGTLFRAEAGPDAWFTVGVFKEQVTVQWLLPAEPQLAEPQLPEPLPELRRMRARDHLQWTTLKFTFLNDQITGAFVDAEGHEEVGLSAPLDVAAWQRLVQGGDVHLGGLRPRAPPLLTTPPTMFDNTTDTALAEYTEGEELAPDNLAGEYFKGCLGAVHVGGLLLPFFTEEELFVGAAAALLAAQPHYKLLAGRGWGAAGGVGCVLCLEQDCVRGHCADVRTQYSCACPPGYEGDYCQVDVDECARSECRNGATCRDGVAAYTCDCPQGFDGDLCERDVDECQSAPCANGGTCRDLPGGFECACPPLWRGATCRTPRRRHCAHEPCTPGRAVCRDVPDAAGNNYTCECAAGYEGVHCERAFCEAPPAQCVHGACLASATPPACECEPGFAGRLCDTERDECAEAGAAACQHGGRCQDQRNGFRCDCTGTGWTGVHCEVDVDECALGLVSCGPGECVNLEGAYTCQCARGFCGHECALRDPCFEPHENRTGPCLHDAPCEQRCAASADYACRCSDGWDGKNCSMQAVSEGTRSGAGVLVGVGAALLALALLAAGLAALAAQARRKRATRGTYSPSGQEYCNPRAEMMHHALKPPPEERLI